MTASATGWELGLQHTFAEQLEGLCAPWSSPGFPKPELLQYNRLLAGELGWEELAPERAAGAFSGTRLPRDARPVAQAYAGHQFGGFSPQLGDGRAVLLGERLDPQGRRQDIHLKGSGPTPFSRGGDGKAAIGPVLREYLLGEAMHALGVPTTRVLAAVRTGETIERDRPLAGAVLARVASSHLRVGTLQFLTARGNKEGLQRVVHYALERHFPDQARTEEPARQLLHSVAEAQARLVADWMLVGFVHGVMNTDNVALSGQTIDYGPCAFMEAYDPKTVFSSIDHQGRYAFGNQPGIGQWNLARMGEALLPLLPEDRAAAVAQVEGALGAYADTFTARYQLGMLKKLGFAQAAGPDEQLVPDLLDWMHEQKQDYTSTFRRLSLLLEGTLASPAEGPLASWLGRWKCALGSEPPGAVAARMNRVNPLYVPRNHLVEEALAAAEAADLGPFRELLQVVSQPLSAQPGRERYAEPAPEGFGPYRTFCGT